MDQIRQLNLDRLKSESSAIWFRRPNHISLTSTLDRLTLKADEFSKISLILIILYSKIEIVNNCGTANFVSVRQDVRLGPFCHRSGHVSIQHFEQPQVYCRHSSDGRQSGRVNNHLRLRRRLRLALGQTTTEIAELSCDIQPIQISTVL